MSRTVHMALSVRGALRWPARELAGLIKHNDGRPMTGQEAREALMDVLSQGIEMLPCSPECDDFDDKTGCRGHGEA